MRLQPSFHHLRKPVGAQGWPTLPTSPFLRKFQLMEVYGLSGERLRNHATLVERRRQAKKTRQAIAGAGLFPREDGGIPPNGFDEVDFFDAPLKEGAFDSDG